MIGYGVIISVFYMYVYVLEMLKDYLFEGVKVLDVGLGILIIVFLLSV